MDLEKLKTYLVDVKGMSEADADAKLSAMEEKDKVSLEAEIVAWAMGKIESNDDPDKKELSDKEDKEKTELSEADKKKKDEDDKKADDDKKAELAAADEKDKQDKKEKEDNEKKLSEARSEITRLSTDFRSSVTSAKLSATRTKIFTRLSKLRAEAKVTPAEIKKINILELSGKSEEAIEAVLKSYSDREPVIPMGMIGSVKAARLASVNKHRQNKMSKLESEVRANMPMVAQNDANKRALADGTIAGSPVMVEQYLDNDPSDNVDVEAEYQAICQILDTGNMQAAKDAIKSVLMKFAVNGGDGEFTESHTTETESQLSALVETVQKMQNNFDSLHKLAGSLT